MASTIRLSSGAITFGLLATGCAGVPAYEAPAFVESVAAQPDFLSEPGDTLDRPRGIDAHWWLTIGYDELDELVTILLDQNLSLKAAVARVEQFDRLAAQAHGARLPSVSASGDVTGREQIEPDSVDFETTYAVSLSAQWDTDIFGGLRASERAAVLRQRSARLSVMSLENALIAELARTYVGAFTLAEQIRISEDLVESFEQTASLTNDRYEAGSAGASALDVQIARQNAASAEADLPNLRAQFDVQRQAIDVLLGQPIGTTNPTYFVSSALDLEPFSAGVPMDLLGQRPDVALAETNLLAAYEDTGVAEARLYPSLSLSAALTQQETQLGVDTLAASLVAQIVGPIYEGGRRRNEVERALFVVDELAADYSAALLSAVADVERALLFEQAAVEEIELRQISLDAAELADELANARYRSGQVSLLAVLETRRALENARQSLVLAEQTRLNARIDLHLALGGDWTPNSPQQVQP